MTFPFVSVPHQNRCLLYSQLLCFYIFYITRTVKRQCYMQWLWHGQEVNTSPASCNGCSSCRSDACSGAFGTNRTGGGRQESGGGMHSCIRTHDQWRRGRGEGGRGNCPPPLNFSYVGILARGTGNPSL